MFSFFASFNAQKTNINFFHCDFIKMLLKSKEKKLKGKDKIQFVHKRN